MSRRPRAGAGMKPTTVSADVAEAVHGGSDSDDEVILTVLRSTGEKAKIPLSLKQTLNDLKTAIRNSEQLGNLSPDRQRLFHMGRELKTSRRSLEALGVGKLGNHVVHVHRSLPLSAPSPPPAASAQQQWQQLQLQQQLQIQRQRQQELLLRTHHNQQQQQHQARISLQDYFGPSAFVLGGATAVPVVTRVGNTGGSGGSDEETARKHAPQQQSLVVDLAEEEDDEDDDDCIVMEVPAAAGGNKYKRPRLS